jgi:hypothetical protein
VNFDKHRRSDKSIDLVSAYKAYWAFEGNLSPFETEYLTHIEEIHKCGSRQIAALAIVTCSELFQLRKKRK